MKFGVQTFTIRKAQRKNFKRAYLPLLDLGIKELEVARIDFTEKNARALASLVKECGIKVRSIQVKPKYVFKNPQRIIDFCAITGCKMVVISMLPFKCILGNEATFYDFIASLDPMCEVYANAGITLAYHHHNWEYVRLENGRTRMAEILSRTSKIGFVHDTYWTAKCGVDPACQIVEFGDRLLGIHLRDLAFSAKGLDVVGHDAAIGDGVINFESVLRSAESVGCSYYVIEQKTDTPYRDIEKSFKRLESIRSKIEDEE